MSSAGTPVASAACSGALAGSRAKSSQSRNDSTSQRAATNASSTSPSLATTWAKAFISGTLAPGFKARWCAASTCGERTRSMRRGSQTISFAPSRSRCFICDANTGCPSVGFAPITTITSASATESKSWVPAEVPNACFKP